MHFLHLPGFPRYNTTALSGAACVEAKTRLCSPKSHVITPHENMLPNLQKHNHLHNSWKSAGLSTLRYYQAQIAALLNVDGVPPLTRHVNTTDYVTKATPAPTVPLLRLFKRRILACPCKAVMRTHFKSWSLHYRSGLQATETGVDTAPRNSMQDRDTAATIPLAKV